VVSTQRYALSEIPLKHPFKEINEEKFHTKFSLKLSRKLNTCM